MFTLMIVVAYHSSSGVGVTSHAKDFEFREEADKVWNRMLGCKPQFGFHIDVYKLYPSY